MTPPKVSRPAFRLTDRDRRVVDFVRRCRLVSRDQIMRMAAFGSLTRANTRLAFLVRERLLTRKLMPSYPGNGGAQALYFLGAQAEELGVDRDTLVQQMRRVRRWDQRHAAHVIAANEILSVFLTALGRGSEGNVLEFQTEPELRQTLLDQALVPDGWVAWTQAGKRFNCFLEIDLHHEGLLVWRRKVLNYLQYRDAGLHDERFGFRSFRVLVVANSAARQKHLRTVAQTAGRLFLFAQLSDITTSNILAPTWVPASGTAPISLVEA